MQQKIEDKIRYLNSIEYSKYIRRYQFHVLRLPEVFVWSEYFFFWNASRVSSVSLGDIILYQIISMSFIVNYSWKKNILQAICGPIYQFHPSHISLFFIKGRKQNVKICPHRFDITSQLSLTSFLGHLCSQARQSSSD